MSSRIMLKIILKILLGLALVLSSLLSVNSASAEGAPLLHKGRWPIRNGHNYQPTEHELRGLHLEDVTPDQAREIDRLYNELLANSEGARKRQPSSEP
jgi:hypothetical protein